MTLTGRATTTTSVPVTRVALLIGSLILLGVAAVCSVAVGASTTVGLGDVLRVLVSDDGSNAHTIVWDQRVPRTILAVAIGAALAVAGALIQTLTRNPLAEPGILGVTMGAGFAITVGSAAGFAVTQFGELVTALVGSVLAASLVFAVGQQSPLRLVLTGVALTYVLQGVSLGMRLVSPEVFDKYRFWEVGSLAGREQVPMPLPLLVIALALVGAALVTRSLSAIALGDSVAKALGTNVVAVRTLVLVLVTVLAATATAIAGPIMFVGLIVPHIARRFAGGSLAWLMGYTVVLGPVLMLLADAGARVLLPTGEVPVAIVTAFIGGPVLIWAVRKYGTVSL